MLNNFIYAKQKSLFINALNNGEVLDEAIVFIEDTKEIWNHGTYFDGSKVDLSNIEESILNILNTKQDAITDLDDIRSGAALGLTAIQESDLATVATSGSYNDLTDKLRIEQKDLNLYLNRNTTAGNWMGLRAGDLICPPSLETNISEPNFRIGYNKSVTDTSPNTYFTLTPNSLNIETNNETVLEVTSTGDGSKFLSNDGIYKEVSGGSSAYPLVNHGTSDTTFTLTPNTFHVWDEVTALDLDFGTETEGVANEYLFQFTSGAEATTLTLPDTVKWADDEVPTIETSFIYQLSILNNLATLIKFNNVVLISGQVYDSIYND